MYAIRSYYATNIYVADGAAIAMDGAGTNALNMSALNDVTAVDRVKLDSGGAIAWALANSRITNDINVAEVHIGNAALQSNGTINLST